MWQPLPDGWPIVSLGRLFAAHVSANLVVISDFPGALRAPQRFPSWVIAPGLSPSYWPRKHSHCGKSDRGGRRPDLRTRSSRSGSRSARSRKAVARLELRWYVLTIHRRARFPKDYGLTPRALVRSSFSPLRASPSALEFATRTQGRSMLALGGPAGREPSPTKEIPTWK